jgi:uncharacterized protein YdeI (YjbR/CyaY-like superfamily)
MPDLGPTLDVATAPEWRAWLEANHATASEIWLVYHAKSSGLPSLPYNDAVDEALCFGWIDSTVKQLGPDGPTAMPRLSSRGHASQAASMPRRSSRGDASDRQPEAPAFKPGYRSQSRAQRFTPRRPGSPVSPMNSVRIRRLIEAGRMTPAGLAAAGDLPDAPLVVPPDILQHLQADPATWQHYQAFPESYQRIRIGWIDGARNRPTVFEQRLRYFLRMTKQNKRYGMVK